MITKTNIKNDQNELLATVLFLTVEQIGYVAHPPYGHVELLMLCLPIEQLKRN